MPASMQPRAGWPHRQGLLGHCKTTAAACMQATARAAKDAIQRCADKCCVAGRLELKVQGC